MKPENGKLGILFLHHEINEVVCNNLSSIRRHHPDTTIVTMSGGEKFQHGYGIEATPDLRKLHQNQPAKASDWLVCSWFLQRRESCNKWWIVEWDTFCRISVREYYAPVWNFPFVAATTIPPYRHPDWHWFRDRMRLPRKLRPYIMGAAPFLYLISETALTEVCRCLLLFRSVVGNGELRFATAANKCGFPPCGFSPLNDRISHISWRKLDNAEAIFHPVKLYVSKP